ncbi:MAG: hypothetical protein QW371_02655 [Candidatus Bathyarchaeia archaeon]
MEYSKRISALSSFIFCKMMDGRGAIYSTYHTGYPSSDKFGVNHEVLSESAGLALLYAYHSKNFTLFRILVNFIRKHLLSPHGTLYWKLNPDLTPYGYGGHYSSALIDDLRVLKALILGCRLWGESGAMDLFSKISRGLEKYRVGGYLVECISWSGSEVYKSNKVILSYLDLEALKLLSEMDEKWRETFESAKRLILGGKRGFFFHTFFDVGAGEYGSMLDVNDSINQILILSYLADVGMMGEASPLFEFLRDRFKRVGEIHGLYDPNGNAVGGVGIGTYALFLSLALKFHDEELAENILRSKILTSQDLNEDSPTYGALIAKWPGDRPDANSFDNLMGAISLELIIRNCSRKADPLHHGGCFAQ